MMSNQGIVDNSKRKVKYFEIADMPKYILSGKILYISEKEFNVEK